MTDCSDTKLDRREFLIVGATSAAVAITLPSAVTAQPSPPTPLAVSKVSFRVNGHLRELDLDARTTLLDALREHLHLTGTKKGCDHGQCGACTVLVGERRILSCLSLAVMNEGRDITTIEGLGAPETLHPMQAPSSSMTPINTATARPGRSARPLAMLGELKAGIPSHASADLIAPSQTTPAEIRERMSGNICRCGAYSNIVDAIAEVAASAA